jgi:putative SOS response-associated peptidase YedK
MCGRFTLLTLGQFTDLFPWIRMPAEPLPVRYNIAPSQFVAVVANDGKNQLDFYKWGLVPFWAKDIAIGNRLVNARAETLEEKSAFRGPLRHHRCLIPADSFYEWKRSGTGKKAQKIPMRIGLKSHRPFAFAGLWDSWHSPDGSELRTCTIITCPPNELLGTIHDRMPVILHEENWREWIAPGDRNARELMPLLKPYPAGEMEAYPVSSRVNSPACDGPECVERVEVAEARPVERGLFD